MSSLQTWGKTGAVRQWFVDNPGEYLSFDDMCDRFDIDRKRAYHIVEKLRSEGLVRSEVLVCLDPERPR